MKTMYLVLFMLILVSKQVYAVDCLNICEPRLREYGGYGYTGASIAMVEAGRLTCISQCLIANSLSEKDIPHKILNTLNKREEQNEFKTTIKK